MDGWMDGNLLSQTNKTKQKTENKLNMDGQSIKTQCGQHCNTSLSKRRWCMMDTGDVFWKKMHFDKRKTKKIPIWMNGWIGQLVNWLANIIYLFI